ncbi:hypothetical protein [Burkholderia gladioli]|uniref:hypothetical protein n=1 Tax=Burkholderia gladioli TaxID=28095 RepID=UPI0010FF057A|nr:hypothetical protein [Burkholderia gladioli]
MKPKHVMQPNERFGKLTFKEMVLAGKSGARYAVFVCDCGNEKEMSVSNVVLGKSKSCGCLAVKTTGDRARTHGMTGTPEYRTWKSMWARCTNPTLDRYPRYGGRGITVCDRWESFEKFYEDMGPRPSLNHSIERDDVDGNYEPGNCRWATKREQSWNTSANLFVEYKGERKCVAEWCYQTGIPYSRFIQRLRRGLPIEDVFDTSKDGFARKSIVVDGISKITTQWMRDAGIPISSFYHFRRKGLSEEEIVRKYLARIKSK